MLRAGLFLVLVLGFWVVFVQVEETPNPSVLRFLLGRSVLEPGSSPVSFSSVEQAVRSPFAARVLDIDGVSSVLFGEDFVSVSKAEDRDWAHLKPFVFHVLTECLARGVPVLLSGEGDFGGRREPVGLFQGGALGFPCDLEAYGEADRAVVSRIVEVLDGCVRPAVARDGGDVRFVHYDGNGTVYVAMHGACSGCPNSRLTLKSGVERTLRFYVPQVTAVVEAPEAPERAEGRSEA